MRDSARDALDNRLARLLRPGQTTKQVGMAGPSTAGGSASDDRTRDSFLNPMTSEGDIIVGDSVGSPFRLAVGADGDVLTADSGAPQGISWQAGGGGSYTDEQAQDAVGTILTDSASIDFTYTDATPEITASVVLEWLQDTVAAMLTGGSHTNITVTYQDASGTIDIAATGGGSYTDEQVRDVIGAALVAGNNIDITVNDGSDTITIDVESLTSSDITDFSEAVDDRVSSLIVAGNNIDVTYNDGANTLTIDVESLTSADITDFTEAVQDAVGVALTDSSSIDFTYNDGANTITAAVIDEAIQDIVGAMVVDTTSIDATYDDAGNQLTLAIKDAYVQDLIDAGAGGEGVSQGTEWVLTHRIAQWSADFVSATITSVAGPAPSTNGTQAQDLDADGPWLRSTSAASSGSIAGRNIAAAALGWYPDWNLTFMARFKTGSDITSARHWIGMFSTAPTGSDAPTASIAAFRRSTGVPDSNWQCVTSDGSGVLSITDSGVSCAADTAYSMRIHFGTSKANFYINDVLVASHSVGGGKLLPATLTQMGWYVTLTNLSGSARQIKFSRVHGGMIK